MKRINLILSYCAAICSSLACFLAFGLLKGFEGAVISCVLLVTTIIGWWLVAVNK